MRIFKHFIPWSIFIFCIIYFQRLEHPEASSSLYITTQLLLIFITLLIFYINYLFLVPKLLINKKLILFLSSILFLLFLGNILSFLIKNYYDWSLGLPLTNIRKLTLSEIINQTITCLVILILSTGFRLISQYNKDRVKRIELKKIAKEAELEALKAQINPHFLYNSFNSLYALAKLKSDKTADAILQLADIMRYVTYKSSQKEVSIHEELNFIKNYIEFQKLRINKPNDKIMVNIKIPKTDFFLSPLLLISFVENAFKHSNLLRTDAKINIDFEPHMNGFSYSVSNIFETKKDSNSGLGLKTLKKILDYTYPKSHKLTTYTEDGIHYAVLDLKIKK